MQPAAEESGDLGHDPLSRHSRPHIDVAVVGVAAEAVASRLQHLVEVVQEQVGEQRRERATLGRALVSPRADALSHHPRFQEAADDPQEAPVADAPRQNGS